MEKTLETMKQLFKGYYFKNSGSVEVPSKISERECGYMPFGGTMIRHLSFSSPGELLALLVKEAPLAAFYSCSFYHEPSLPMHEKGWKGAELIFDIDADDLMMPCKMEHDRWTCKSCNHQGTGLRPEKCPKCGGTRVAELNWICHRCLTGAKMEAFKLIDILVSDLGVSKGEVKTYFSGSMGYHVTVESKLLEELGQAGRNEIADYISGTGLTPESLGITPHTVYSELEHRVPSSREVGWRRRVAAFFKDLPIEGYTDPEGADVREKILYFYRKAEYKGFKERLKRDAKKIGAAIDVGVTTDLHRIFRMPGTLHGETGLAKQRCLDLDDFDPFVDAVALGREEMEVTVSLAPSFTLAGEVYGPFKPGKVKLPAMAAAFLMGHGLARVE